MIDPPGSFDGMPDVLAQVAAVAGFQVACDLGEALGGSRVHVARRPRQGTLLVKAVGLEAARAIARVYGGETIPIPQEPATDRARKQSEIVKRIEQGYSVERICRDLKVDRRTVQRLKVRLREAMQPNLFQRDGG